MGLAARLASKMFVFERGCFTTAGLETVMQVINMVPFFYAHDKQGHATSSNVVDITKSIVLCENMSINQDIPASKLLSDLLGEETGDDMTNRVRQLVKQHFSLQLYKLPFLVPGNEAEHKEACAELALDMMSDLEPLQVGGVHVDGVVVCQLVNELLAQIRGGGSRFNMVTATEALVSNMAAEVLFFKKTHFRLQTLCGQNSWTRSVNLETIRFRLAVGNIYGQSCVKSKDLQMHP